MKVQLLLLVALVGPFCAFTCASPTGPYNTEAETDVTSAAPTPTKLDIRTGPPPTEPHAAPDVVHTSTSFVTDGTEEPMTPTYVGAATSQHPPSVGSTAPTEETTASPSTPEETTTTPSTTEETTASTAAPTKDSMTPTAALPEETTYAAAAPPEITTPADPTEDEDQTYLMETHSLSEEVTIDESNEGLTSGQIVGIVIGAILAVVLVTAVVFAFVRRMGKYSP
ncbi:mucin-7 isoform X2 [Kryptolebias marmoratus]|uniref:mucin-7 isoform X2 n=1 Tax=Kryptolebias marmoratus TaxID=37003 RepID=UPI0018AD0104|nr:mucin-7 isoform X2 [Kryptolebias marmoratus]